MVGRIRLSLELRCDPTRRVRGPRLSEFGLDLLEIDVAAGEERRQVVGGNTMAEQVAEPVFDRVCRIPARPVLVVNALQFRRLVPAVRLCGLDGQSRDRVTALVPAAFPESPLLLSPVTAALARRGSPSHSARALRPGPAPARGRRG